MNKNKKVWIGMISIGLALLLFAVLMMIQQSMLKEPEKERVLYARTKIPQNTMITEENISLYIEEQDIPVMWLPEGYVSERKLLYGMISTGEIAKGSILNQNIWKSYEEYYDNYEELNWISVPIDELYKGVAGSLRDGDYIDIYLIYEEDKTYVCEMLAEKVRIESVYSSQGERIGVDDKEGLCQLIVIPIEKKDTSVFYEKLVQGNIRIAKYEAK